MKKPSRGHSPRISKQELEYLIDAVKQRAFSEPHSTLVQNQGDTLLKRFIKLWNNNYPDEKKEEYWKVFEETAQQGSPEPAKEANSVTEPNPT